MIEIIINKIWVYMFIFIVVGFLFFKLKQDFKPERLLDYTIFLTTKIILFFIFISFLLIIVMSLLDGSQTLIDNFIQELSIGLLYYALFNYGVFGVLKGIIYFVDFFKKNDLLAFSLLKESDKK